MDHTVTDAFLPIVLRIGIVRPSKEFPFQFLPNWNSFCQLFFSNYVIQICTLHRLNTVPFVDTMQRSFVHLSELVKCPS